MATYRDRFGNVIDNDLLSFGPPADVARRAQEDAARAAQVAPVAPAAAPHRVMTIGPVPTMEMDAPTYAQGSPYKVYERPIGPTPFQPGMISPQNLMPFLDRRDNEPTPPRALLSPETQAAHEAAYRATTGSGINPDGTPTPERQARLQAEAQARYDADIKAKQGVGGMYFGTIAEHKAAGQAREEAENARIQKLISAIPRPSAMTPETYRAYAPLVGGLLREVEEGRQRQRQQGALIDQKDREDRAAFQRGGTEKPPSLKDQLLYQNAQMVDREFLPKYNAAKTDKDKADVLALWRLARTQVSN